jgi:hypothetical protein
MQKPKQKRSNIGPGKVVTSLYLDSDFFDDIKERAACFGMNPNQYLLTLAAQDIHKGGDLVLTPIKPLTRTAGASGKSEKSEKLLSELQASRGKHQSAG